jgi:hypothetical protein
VFPEGDMVPVHCVAPAGAFTQSMPHPGCVPLRLCASTWEGQFGALKARYRKALGWNDNGKKALQVTQLCLHSKSKLHNLLLCKFALPPTCCGTRKLAQLEGRHSLARRFLSASLPYSSPEGEGLRPSPLGTLCVPPAPQGDILRWAAAMIYWADDEKTGAYLPCRSRAGIALGGNPRRRAAA